MCDHTPAIARPAILSENVARAVAFSHLPGVRDKIVISVNLAKALEPALIFASPIAFGIRERHELFASEDNHVG